ncbi:MAG: cytochrome c [Planctomycetota bacterium]
MNRSLKIFAITLAMLFGLGALVGCDVPIDSFPSNEVFAKRWELTESIEMDQPVEDSEVLLEELFGTPNEPRWPEFLQTSENLITLKSLERAAGAFSSEEDDEHRGLFREHCVVCHGIAGNGRGPSAALLDPYPRDFRMGKFKFKATPLGKKPTREDLKQVLLRGIAGTSMPSFQLLDPADIESLVDYLIYLSVRGELERKVLADAAIELDLEDGERLYDPTLKNRFPEEFEGLIGRIERWGTEIYAKWLEADNNTIEVVGPPEGFPLLGSGADEQAVAASVANGKKIFQGTVASCAFCHGKEAKGDGQRNNFDAWTRDWTSLAGLNPKDQKELRPMLELGALKPRNILPRNLTLGIFHGGSSPEELYTRVKHGIEGTNMPAVPMKPDNPQGLSNEEVWDLVNYLRSFLPPEKQALESDDALLSAPQSGNKEVASK